MTDRAVSLERRGSLPPRRRPAALAAVGLARLLTLLPPSRLRRVLEFLRRGAAPATGDQAARARDAVVAVSVACAGPRCLQRSLATVLLCRAHGVWPDWCVGVRTQPFLAHAWVAVDGRPVGENDEVRYFHLTMTVPSPR
ncbi:lasso peptide biosynthesis B2 protein [Streptomyces sp. NPDC057638]|uniref:lasso peptide biosynthesis B2 protein n=1 Tax=Streptomyces sp. NPDC057638 TaxID=3346190 RepID=UPI0036A528B2